MKNNLMLAACVVLAAACNNETRQAVNDADSANESKETTKNDSGLLNRDSSTATLGRTDTVSTDKDGAEFLVRAAAGGRHEVTAARMGQEKGLSEDVKRFSGVLIRDHEAANREVETMAGRRNVTLPAETAPEHADDMAKLQGNKFDRKYMDQMVSDHKKTIDLFEKYSDKTKDADIRAFIQKTLPVLHMHLDSAQAIEKIVKKVKR
ncbi:DUF4142 domain-containing protein [Flavihumibacter petaseus]|uniref:DUF4142 domain-containing protein n=1 Tax=Flavihumibacter petaseus NBRC 106054 TaxID=1220578 RepID=A0A0E9MUZ7_9BACT|nr:DUF4142 domain-containing protein [Flavihumibacter petaseus]GAO41572.1 hypothetical protein FPE01S_01_05860 [Flavihumibacter petaseus NBRC 106054]